MLATAVSDEDRQFIEKLPNGIIMEFRDKVFPKSIIEQLPSLFLSYDWIKVDELRAFYEKHPSFQGTSTVSTPSPSQSASQTAQTCVKAEEIEPELSLIAPEPLNVQVRTVVENGKDYMEILDTDDEEDMPQETANNYTSNPSSRCSSPTVIGDASSDGFISEGPVDDIENESEDEELRCLVSGSDGLEEGSQDGESSGSEDFDSELEGLGERRPSDTKWFDPNIQSEVLEHVDGFFCITRELRVKRLEFLTNIPMYWPIPVVSTAFILDLRDQKFVQYDKNGKLMSVDALIKNKVDIVFFTLTDQDSWRGGTGAG
ncbi:hypothetical protein K435DRAFT_810173 [Dendrothele bispora CBS 962.96]|uniref:Uncharacterized protein n=1 Tax=Dendrothele bispora (strain CBS 962.96) TaxID=1314807 RepID=A0A4S8KVW0_DENBC|nr:hypothetical protein K435DRAFT_810173 [Dendrothele bispora CBS 962.96]